jgi:dihydroneopterin aldolase
MNDRIHIFGATLPCRIGVSGQERSTPQPMVLDMSVGTDIAAAAAADDIHLAINYSELLTLALDVAAEREYRLIETLAETLAARVLARFNVSDVHILLKKPGALARRGALAAAVEITRMRND